MTPQQRQSVAQDAKQLIDRLVETGKDTRLCQVFLYLRKLEHEEFRQAAFPHRVGLIFREEPHHKHD